jgi:hypothetical protein
MMKNQPRNAKRWSVSVLGVAVVATVLGSGSLASADDLIPLATYAKLFDADTMLVRFGYENTFDTTLLIPIGPSNRFSPPNENEGQPTSFAIGRHEDIFSLHVNGGDGRTWSLMGTDLTCKIYSYDDAAVISDQFNLTAGSGLWAPAGVTVVAGGVLNIEHATAYRGDTTAIEAGGTLGLFGGSAGSASGITNAGLIVAEDATIGGPIVHYPGSTVDVTGDLFFEGFVSGTPTFTGDGTTRFEGGFSPGPGAVSVSFEGSGSFGPANLTKIELAGLADGEFDRLLFGGDVDLDGTLGLSLVSPFTLSGGDEFKILDVAGTLTGQFSGLDEGALIDLGDGNPLLQLTYAGGDGNDVVLTALPEPASAMLLVVGGLASVTRRRSTRS